MKIEWLDGELTRASITVEAAGSHWWRRRWITAEIESGDPLDGYARWRFVRGGDRVCDHDDDLAQEIEREWRLEDWRRRSAAKQAGLKNPWTVQVTLPPARTVKR